MPVLIEPSPLVKLSTTAYIWSFSKYKIYKECNERYTREYLQHQRLPPNSQKPFFQGSVAHNLIEEGRDAVLAGETTDLASWCATNLARVFATHAANVTDWLPGEIERAEVEAQEVTQAYVKLVLENELLTGRVLCEHTIGTRQKPRYLSNGVGLTGFIDWAKFISDTEVLVLDAKTSRNTNWLDRDQLVFYALAMESEFNVVVNRVAWMMIRWGQTLWYDITEDDKSRLRSNLLTASLAVEQIDLHTDPTHGRCTPCPHSGVCATYAHWILDGGVAATDVEF